MNGETTIKGEDDRPIKKQLAKIYYQDQEVEDIAILLIEPYFRIYIGPFFVKESVDPDIIGLRYTRVTNCFTEIEEKEGDDFCDPDVIVPWNLKNKDDKIIVNHDKSGMGVMIKWIDGNKVRVIGEDPNETSLFIPITRILSIIVNENTHIVDDKVIEK